MGTPVLPLPIPLCSQASVFCRSDENSLLFPSYRHRWRAASRPPRIWRCRRLHTCCCCRHVGLPALHLHEPARHRSLRDVQPSQDLGLQPSAGWTGLAQPSEARSAMCPLHGQSQQTCRGRTSCPGVGPTKVSQLRSWRGSSGRCTGPEYSQPTNWNHRAALPRKTPHALHSAQPHHGGRTGTSTLSPGVGVQGGAAAATSFPFLSFQCFLFFIPTLYVWLGALSCLCSVPLG